MPNFTNYFQPNEGPWRALLEYLKWDPRQPHTVVEVGSFEGSSAWWMMTNMLLAPQSKLYCVDPWAFTEGEETYQRFLANMAELPNGSQVEVVRDWSHKGLRRLVNEGVQADLLYVDGDHAAHAVLRDLVVGFELVKPGGVVICDDYLWDDPKFGGGDTLGRPKIAVDAFTTIFHGKIRVLRGMQNIQVGFVKIAD